MFLPLGVLFLQHQFSRTELLIGPAGLQVLAGSKVAVFGIGGVGSYTVEALARAGVGRLEMIDYDDICLTNINRQIHALHSTVGESKVEAMKSRVLDINPRALVRAVREFYTPENGAALLATDCDYVVDAMDTVAAKVHLIAAACRMGIPVVSCMGAGNRLDPSAFKVADIAETQVCPLARAVRRELRKVGIERGVRVVYSPDHPLAPDKSPVDCRNNCICPGGDAHCAMKRQIPGSISFVPPVAGLLLASVVVNDLLNKNGFDGAGAG